MIKQLLYIIHKVSGLNMKKTISIFLLSFMSIITFSNSVQARIDIVPRKIIIENRERSGDLTILNLTNEVSTFRMDIVSFRQNENGIYEELEAPLNPAFDPASIVRFSPRQFTLKGGGRQKVRLSIRKPANLPDGEYRFHIKALRLAQPDPNLPNGVYLHANIGVTIPVVVRNGDTSVQARISDVKLVGPSKTEKNRPELHLQINRQGTESAIGTLAVFWKPQGSSERKIGNIGNMNVFTDVDKRFVQIPLTEMPYGKGTITVRYLKDSDKTDSDKGEVYDEVSLQR